LLSSQLKKRIMSLEIDFQKNCNEEDGSILFTREVRLVLPSLLPFLSLIPVSSRSSKESQKMSFQATTKSMGNTR